MSSLSSGGADGTEPLPPVAQDITLLCRVVDNYGDIGFVYRLARALSRLAPEARLRLVVSDLASFAAMAPGIDAAAPAQEYRGWQVFAWDAAATCTAEFKVRPPRVILECFQCGRPEWLDALLFTPAGAARPGAVPAATAGTAAPALVHIINVEYLTAEPWADDFHLLTGATRSASVKKMHFMPGFTARTGGLLLEPPEPDGSIPPQVPPGCAELLSRNDVLSVLLFAYPRDFSPLVAALSRFRREQQADVQVLCAAGLSGRPFLDAWHEAGRPFPVMQLPYLPQQAWDALLVRSAWNFVRGEDSFARACLAGHPFVWHAYPQDGEFQLVKVDAFLSRIQPFLSPDDFSLYRRYSLLYSRRSGTEPGAEAQELLCSLAADGAALPAGAETARAEEELLLYALLCRRKALSQGFARFAGSLRRNGNLAKNLLDCIKRLQF